MEELLSAPEKGETTIWSANADDPTADSQAAKAEAQD